MGLFLWPYKFKIGVTREQIPLCAEPVGDKMDLEYGSDYLKWKIMVLGGRRGRVDLHFSPGWKKAI